MTDGARVDRPTNAFHRARRIVPLPPNLAYEMNDQVLSVAHGASIRLRVERQLGYKTAKYLMLRFYPLAIDCRLGSRSADHRNDRFV
jgi:Oxidoreductase molybdopterin binding domain